MTDLQSQLRAFAEARGGKLRYGPQPPKPKADTPVAGIGPSENPQFKPKAVTPSDPWIDYTDDYSLWCRTRRGE